MFESFLWETGAILNSTIGNFCSRGTSSGIGKNPIAMMDAIAIGLDEFTKIHDYYPSFMELGSPKDEAIAFARIIIRADTAGIELTESNIDRLEPVTRYNKKTMQEAMIKWLLVKFLRREKKLSLADLGIVYKVQEALYSGDQKNDLDDVSKTTGIPLDVVRNIDNMMEEFLSKWSVGPQTPTGDNGGNPKKKPPKTKPITVDDPNGPQGSLNP